MTLYQSPKSTTYIPFDEDFIFYLQKNSFSLENLIYRVHDVLAGKIAEKPVWRSVFLTKWHYILNADSTKTHSSSVAFSRFYEHISFRLTLTKSYKAFL